jgi:tetratricopeptide (TPR) repeat protein
VKWYPLGYTNYSIFDLQKSIIHGLRRYSTSLLLAISLSLAGQDTDAAETQPDLRNGVEQRIKLTQSYLASKTAQKIAETGNSQARQLLQKARELLAQASAQLSQGNLEAAQKNVNLSLQAFTAAGAANNKPAASTENLALEVGSIRNEIDAYLESFTQALSEKGPSMAGLLDRQYVADLLSRAEQSQSLGEFDTARSALNQAKQLVVAALIKIRNNETVVYTVEFQTPADEFRYERERYQEYTALGQKLLDSGELETSRVLLFEQLKKNGERLSQEALALAGKGDYPDAINRMEMAVIKLIQGLRLLGVTL